MECFAYASSQTYDLRALQAKLTPHFACSLIGEVLHIKWGDKGGDLFYFQYGTCVTWGISPSDFNAVQKQVIGKPATLAPESAMIRDEFSYSYGEKPTLLDDEIVLESKNFEAKLAASYAISQSIKLEVFEHTTDLSIETTRALPENLARKGKISLGRRALSKKIGTLFLERSSINLHTDILDLPDFFWENTELEPFYLRMRRYLNLDSRMDVLNKRLHIIHEMLEMLGSELNHRQSSRLEWTIIILILLEVIVLFAKDVFGWF